MNTAGADSLEFAPVGVLDTKCSTSDGKVRSNVEINIRRDLPRLHQLPDYGKWKKPPLAIVAGGPSLNSSHDELEQFEHVMVCGSAHDPLIDLGFVPEFAVLCDAHPSEADCVKLADNRCTYFIASMCDPLVFDALEEQHVVMWHNFQGDLSIFGDETPYAIMGGCTVTLRALNIALMLGWNDLHFFGFDSSFPSEGPEYAYEGNPPSGKRILARAGGRVFETTTAWLAQATHFREMCLNMGFMFRPTIHGDGLIAEMMRA